jgi:hypothetical protein
MATDLASKPLGTLTADDARTGFASSSRAPFARTTFVAWLSAACRNTRSAAMARLLGAGLSA